MLQDALKPSEGASVLPKGTEINASSNNSLEDEDDTISSGLVLLEELPSRTLTLSFKQALKIAIDSRIERLSIQPPRRPLPAGAAGKRSQRNCKAIADTLRMTDLECLRDALVALLPSKSQG